MCINPKVLIKHIMYILIKKERRLDLLFEDYESTGLVYHIADINDLKEILEKGIRYNDKSTYLNRYLEFHKFFDLLKPDYIPNWVIREKAIFASMNFKKDHYFHSHSVVLGLKVDIEKCWIANENLANCLYEPLVLQKIEEFVDAKKYIENIGVEKGREYWETSLSFIDNLSKRKDMMKDYDEEVLIFHPIEVRDIVPLYIVSDHKMLTIDEWKKIFKEQT